MHAVRQSKDKITFWQENEVVEPQTDPEMTLYSECSF